MTITIIPSLFWAPSVALGVTGHGPVHLLNTDNNGEGLTTDVTWIASESRSREVRAQRPVLFGHRDLFHTGAHEDGGPVHVVLGVLAGLARPFTVGCARRQAPTAP